MDEQPTVSYLLPAYNEAATLPKSVPVLVARLRDLPGSEILIIENGSADGTFEVADRLASELSAPEVVVRAVQSDKGLGRALRCGIEQASAAWVVCTAADLPFGFTDLDGMQRVHDRADVVIGSKGHPDSRGDRPLGRRIMTATFRFVRLLVLGMRVRDPQGSLLVRTALAKEIGPLTVDNGFLFGTELVAHALQRGASVVEVPIELQPLRGGSTVRPIQDSLRMLRGLISLRRRLALRAAEDGYLALDRHQRPARWLEWLVARGVPAAVVAAVAVVSGLAAVVAGPLAVAAITAASDQLRESGPLAGRPRLAFAALSMAVLAVSVGWVAWRRRREGRAPTPQ